MEDNTQPQNQSQPQNTQDFKPNEEAPFMLPLTDTESYHHLAPTAPIIPITNKAQDEISSFPEPAQTNTDPTQINDSGWHAETPEEKYLSFRDAVFHIEIEKIKPNPFQPRRIFDEESLKELAASIREFGILQPIIVTKVEKEVENGTLVEYQLIAGERRLMAAKMAGLERVPAIVKRLLSDAVKMEMAIVENLQRSNLNPVETARAYAKLQDQFSLTQREIATKLGKSRETIANSIRLLNLPGEIQDALSEGKINESQGRLLLTIDDINQQMNIFRDLLSNNMSVRELKNRIRRDQQPTIYNPQPTTDNSQQSTVDPELNAMQEQLMELLGAPVRIDPPTGGVGGRGKIVIQFFSPEEVKGIIDKIHK